MGVEGGCGDGREDGRRERDEQHGGEGPRRVGKRDEGRGALHRRGVRREGRRSPLDHACFCGKLEFCAGASFRRGASIKEKDDFGRTPLHQTFTFKHLVLRETPRTLGYYFLGDTYWGGLDRRVG